MTKHAKSMFKVQMTVGKFQEDILVEAPTAVIAQQFVEDTLGRACGVFLASGKHRLLVRPKDIKIKKVTAYTD
jgi:hypothetical protein